MEMKSIYKGGLILLLGFIFLKIGGMLFRFICMSALPVEDYGQVALFLVLSNWFALFATFNVTIGLAKFVSQNQHKKSLYYSSALFGTILLSLAVSVILLALSPQIAQALNMDLTVVYWSVACVPFAAVYNIGIFYFRGNFRMGASTKADAVMMVIRIAALVGLLYASVQYSPYMAFLISFMAIDAYLLVMNRGNGGFTMAEKAREFRALLIYSFPIFLGEFLRTFATGFDRMAIAGFYSTAAAGIYDVAVSLCLGYVIIANSYSNALLPVASNHHHDAGNRRKALFRSLKASAVLFLLYGAILMLAGRAVITIVNPVYLQALDIIIPMSVAYVLIGFMTIMYFYANSVGRQRDALYAGAVFAFLSMFLNLYLVPQMMYEGAVTALSASSAASIFVLGVLLWRAERRS